ncbi:MAG: SGNH/GDSL hydrolase family protein, partial [Acidimicrobiaceae bacterium]
MSGSVKKSRAAVERRNLIVPQMRDYDELGMRQEWVPHLMYFHPRNAALKSVTTDEFGFRNTTGAKPGAPTALLVGGSSVFGIGATSDAMTIPSLLNTATKYNWLNFGGRAFNSTQEAILVHLSNTKNIDGPIVVMSG